jgi:hypothetical protein
MRKEDEADYGDYDESAVGDDGVNGCDNSNQAEKAYTIRIVKMNITTAFFFELNCRPATIRTGRTIRMTSVTISTADAVPQNGNCIRQYISKRT